MLLAYRLTSVFFVIVCYGIYSIFDTFPYSKAVQHHNFHPRLLEIRERLREKYGHKEANRQFVSILLLRRQCSQKELLNGVEKALTWGAIDQAAIETIIRQSQIPEHYQEEPPPIKSVKWGFDLTPYAELCKEVVL